MHQWELFYLKVIKKEEKRPFSYLLRFLLWMVSFPYRTVMKVRNLAYDHGWFSSYTPPAPLVISVGNLVAGGTGKTPVTLMIAEAFYNEFPLAVLARGYRSEAERLSTPVVVSRGYGPTHPASYSGDEAFLIAENFPKAAVVVGRNRRDSSCIAAKMGAKLILLDDGMQHRKIQRDKEVVVMDVNDPWGLGYYLPRGLMREGKSGLKRADLVVLNHSGDHKAFEKLKCEVSKLTSAPVVGTQMLVTDVLDLQNNPVEIVGKKVALFCGIAHPDYFVKTVNSLGVEVLAEHFLADHERICLDSLLEFSAEAKKAGAEYLICTEKDKVKITAPVDALLPIVWVKVKLQVVEGKKDYDLFIESGRQVLRQ